MRAKDKANLKKVLVVTGGIGSGKTTVTNILAEMGATCISADLLAREVVLPGSKGLELVTEEFGREVLAKDGSLDRKSLADTVFKSEKSRLRLEKILHPLIADLSAQRIGEAQSKGAKLVVYDCPLYYEANLQDKGFGAVLLVYAPKTLSQERVAKRDGVAIEDIAKRQAAQISIDEKKKTADFIVSNEGTLQDLKDSISQLAPQLFAINDN